ncbi:VG15 protein [Streptomyces sp. DB-54]
MAPVSSPRQLADAHRRAQVALASYTAGRVMSDWQRMVQPRRIEETAPQWMDASLGAITASRSRSRGLAASYLRLHRALNTHTTLPPYAPAPVAEATTLGNLRRDFASRAQIHLPPATDDGRAVVIEDDYTWPDEDRDALDAAARTSLAVTGPVQARRRLAAVEGTAGRGRLDDTDFLDELDTLMRDAGASAAAAADREVLRGGRDLLHRALSADPRVVGWARMTSSDPCAWCAMLASRGAVYRSRDAAQLKGHAGRNAPPVDLEDLEKYHDQCHCQVVPIYSRTAWLPEQGRAFRELWDEATDGHTGRDAINAYRRAIDARRRRARSRGVLPAQDGPLFDHPPRRDQGSGS